MSRRFLLVAAFALAFLVAAGSTAPVSASGGWSFTPVVTGLKIPRGIAFDGQGAMYVAESGLAGSGAQGIVKGFVDKYTLGTSAHLEWQTEFTSAFLGEGGRSEVIGPAGLTATGNGCARGGPGVRNGCQLLVIVGLNHHEIPVGDFGHLFSLDMATGDRTDRADIGGQEYAWTDAHKDLWSEFPDSNPYGVLVTHGGAASSGNTFVIDAGANTVARVDADGTIHVIAYIPNESPALGLPSRDSTPTCAALGPDGMLYVGTLDLARNFVDPAQGHSHVYRVDPRGTDPMNNATVWASGLTAVTSCTFDDAGNFWAAEMFKFNQAAPPGDIVRIPFADPTTVEHIGGGHLPFPGGIAQGGDGAMYVTTFATGANAPIGAVVRVSAD